MRSLRRRFGKKLLLVCNVQMDDRTADLFTEFLQVRGHGVPQPLSVPPTDPFRMSLLIRDLKKLGVKPFEGKVNHMKADRWIRNLENYFKILGMTSVEKNSAASFYLHDEARVWCDAVERSQNVDQMDWEGFLALFLQEVLSCYCEGGITSGVPKLDLRVPNCEGV